MLRLVRALVLTSGQKGPPLSVMTPIDSNGGLSATLANQRAAFLRDSPPSLQDRRRDSLKLKHAILAREDAFVTALNADFGHRSREETLLFDVGSTVGGINYLLRNVARWIRPEPRGVAMAFLPGSNRIIYQPLGVVGIVSPWNYPVGLALIPLATALAAGNRAMLKPSELVPATTELLAAMMAETFPSGSDRRGHWRRQGRKRLRQPSLRPPAVHREHPGRSIHDARGERELGAGHARAWRQVARHHRTRLLVAQSGTAHHLWQARQLRPDLRGA